MGSKFPQPNQAVRCRYTAQGTWHLPNVSTCHRCGVVPIVPGVPHIDPIASFKPKASTGQRQQGKAIAPGGNFLLQLTTFRAKSHFSPRRTLPCLISPALRSSGTRNLFSLPVFPWTIHKEQAAQEAALLHLPTSDPSSQCPPDVWGTYFGLGAPAAPWDAGPGGPSPPRSVLGDAAALPSICTFALVMILFLLFFLSITETSIIDFL